MRLVFSNAEATPHNVALDVSEDSVDSILSWYGAYYAGDRYTVTLDGRDVPIDMNGERRND
jgi:hypothetical protein